MQPLQQNNQIFFFITNSKIERGDEREARDEGFSKRDGSFFVCFSVFELVEDVLVGFEELFWEEDNFFFLGKRILIKEKKN